MAFSHGPGVSFLHMFIYCLSIAPPANLPEDYTRFGFYL